jgi:hypothetical protein
VGADARKLQPWGIKKQATHSQRHAFLKVVLLLRWVEEAFVTPPKFNRTPPALMKRAPSLAEFYAAWQACGKGEIMPRLADYLDAPSFRLQPYVSIVDLHSNSDLRIRLFGTGLVTLAGQDFTSRSVAPIYTPEDMALACATAWTACGHPAGYTCMRAVRTSGGLIIECDCVCLPLIPPTGVPRCMITMLHVPEDLPRLSTEKDVRTISGFRWLDWIDIGAGVPG